MLTITNFSRGARGIRVAWLCEELGVPYRVQLIGYPVPDSYRARNPLGQVPFLEDEHGLAMTESVAMLFYIAQAHGPTPLLPPQGDPRFSRVLQMTVFSEATLGAALNVLLTDRFALSENEQGGVLQRTVRSRVEQAIGYVAIRLGENKFVAGPSFTIADMSIAGSLALWRGVLRGELPDNLAAYLDGLIARPAYVRAATANG
ncbi:MAG: glutathione S-transferase family protein [Rhizomicrobium sp.]|jgi:glutathione S-transferase